MKKIDYKYKILSLYLLSETKLKSNIKKQEVFEILDLVLNGSNLKKW